MVHTYAVCTNTIATPKNQNFMSSVVVVVHRKPSKFHTFKLQDVKFVSHYIVYCGGIPLTLHNRKCVVEQ